MRSYILARAVGVAAVTLMFAAGGWAGTPRAASFSVPPTTEATLTAQQAAIGGAYVAPGKYPSVPVQTFPPPITVIDTQSPGDKADPQNIPTALIREWAIMGPADDGSGLLTGARESRLRRFGRFLLTLSLIGGVGFGVFRRGQKHLDATLRGWGLHID